MPIRFRCAYCNQLMAIARRKAGTVVRCPTCAGQVVVPPPEGVAKPVAARQAAAPPGGVFERSDFEDLFEAPTARQPGAASPPAPPTGAVQASSSGFDVEPVALGPVPAGAKAAGGLLLTPARGMLLGMMVLVLLGLAFLAGFLVGQSGV